MKIRDDRGRVISVVRDRSAASPEARWWARNELSRHRLRMPRRSMQIVIYIVAVVVVGLTMAGLGLDPSYAEFVTIALILAFIIGAAWYLRRKHLKAALKSARICPACGYELRGLPVETDDCTVCPECGAAWRLEHESHGDSARDATP